MAFKITLPPEVNGDYYVFLILNITATLPHQYKEVPVPAVLLRQGQGQSCVQSDERILAGFSSPDSCLHCHKEGQKKDSREGVAWKGPKCIMCLMISAAEACQKGLPVSVAQMMELVWVSTY